jgi:hypothetical protein
VTDLLGKSAYVSLEPDLTSGVGRNRRLDHVGLYGYQLGSYNHLCDTVRLWAQQRTIYSNVRLDQSSTMLHQR